jgi:tight adherence protein C
MGAGQRSAAETVRQRMDRILNQRAVLADDELRQPLFERLFRPMLDKFAVLVARFAPDATLKKLQETIRHADMTHVFDGSTFMTLRVFAGVGFGLCLATLTLLAREGAVQVFLFGLIGGLLAYLMPTFWLKGKVKKRQAAIRAALPDMLDMLTLCTGVMGFERALGRVAESTPPILRAELLLTMREMRALDMLEALQRFADRVDIEELTILVATIGQSRQLGTPLDQVLQDQSVDMRVRRRQRAETLARQAPIKMMFPLVLLVFPPIFIVLLGPSIPQIVHAVAPRLHL